MKWIVFFIAIAGLCQGQSYLKGYANTLRGEVLAYESTQPEANASLLLRSLDARNFIAWETEPLPETFDQDTATFVFIAGIDVNAEDSHRFQFFVNDEVQFSFSNPLHGRGRCFEWRSETMRLEYKGLLLDKYGDYMGYMYLHIPVAQLKKGAPVHLKVIGESAESRSWFMIFTYGCENSVKLTAENAIRNTPQGPRQQLRFSVVSLGDDADGEIRIGNQSYKQTVRRGLNTLRLPVDCLTEAVDYPVRVSVGQHILFDEILRVEPATPLTIHLLHHSHVDIGYTHVQDEVEKMQWQYLDEAVYQHGLNAQRPPEARIKWNTEVMWAVDSYMKQASPQQRENFIAAVKGGSIELNALYSNTLFGLCNEEALYRHTADALRIGALCGVTPTSAMITDIPGWSWGIVPVLAQSGVRYLSLGTNPFHRIGDIITEWGDRPFYWVSRSGREKVLVWIHQKGYALFHAGLNLCDLNYQRYENLIIDYADGLKAAGVPYDMIPLRYNIGSDNGPIDTTLSHFVQQWNEKYVSPRLVISTVTEAFSAFEEKYGHTLPEQRGDLTGYWEDGAASSAWETAMNQASAERLVQAQTLWALNRPADYPKDRFDAAWKQVMLFDEHTWGAHNSISEPEGDFAKAQWRIKRQFALDADSLSHRLLAQSAPLKENASAVTVFNTSSWARSALVTLPMSSPNEGQWVLIDSDRQVHPVQRLADGSTVFLAPEIPALSAAVFRWKWGQAERSLPLKTGPLSLENAFLAVHLDETQGGVAALIDKATGVNLIDSTQIHGFNQYVYVEGRSPESASGARLMRIRPGENGPVLASLILDYAAPGCRALSTEIRLIAGVKAVEIINRLDKEKVYRPEGVHFAFPFAVDNAVTRLGLANGHMRAGVDQLPGANLNYPTVRRWVDLSNAQHGVTWISPDAPLIELTEISTDPTAFGWLENLTPSSRFYSYVMNNYWETNYCAAQEGEMTFRYSLIPHGRFQAAEVERAARGVTRPLLAFRGNLSGTVAPSMRIHNDAVLLDAIRPVNSESWLVRLVNVSDSTQRLELPGAVRLKGPGAATSHNPLPGDTLLMPSEAGFFLIDMK